MCLSRFAYMNNIWTCVYRTVRANEGFQIALGLKGGILQLKHTKASSLVHFPKQSDARESDAREKNDMKREMNGTVQ